MSASEENIYQFFQFFLLILGSLKIFLVFARLLSSVSGILSTKRDLKTKYGPKTWAVVTGASDGIGKAFCKYLANEGFNIVLIARSKDKLEQAAKELESVFKDIETKIIVADFKSSFFPEFYTRLEQELIQLDISILVNNVGVCFKGQFHQVAEPLLGELLKVNCTPIILLSRMLIPLLIKRGNNSAIINLASNSGRRPMPYNALYSATKAFDDYFSRAISQEYVGKISILSLCPSVIRTKMTSDMKESFVHINPEEFVQTAFGKLGNTPSTAGHWRHILMAEVMMLLPDFIFKKVLRK